LRQEKPGVRTVPIGSNSVPVVVRRAQIEHSLRIPLPGSFVVPANRFFLVPVHSLANQVHDPEPVFRVGVSLICRFPVPLHSRFVILGNSIAVFISFAKIKLRGRIARFSPGS
jgi:hypothetical protein